MQPSKTLEHSARSRGRPLARVRPRPCPIEPSEGGPLSPIATEAGSPRSPCWSAPTLRARATRSKGCSSCRGCPRTTGSGRSATRSRARTRSSAARRAICPAEEQARSGSLGGRMQRITPRVLSSSRSKGTICESSRSGSKARIENGRSTRSRNGPRGQATTSKSPRTTSAAVGESR